MINKRNWEEFRNTGLLWFVNFILHLFGWAIVYEIEGGMIKEVYPARVKYRGFDEKTISEGYLKISQYLENNISELRIEAEE